MTKKELETAKKPHKYEIDMLRILACLLVIFSHISCTHVYEPYHQQWEALNIMYVFRNPCVPLFLCITGIVSMNKDRKYTYYIKNAIKFYALFFIILFPLTLFTNYEIHVDSLSLGTLLTIYQAGMNVQLHLWYLPLIAKIYLLIPILRKITESEKLSRIYLIIWVWSSSICPLLSSLTGAFIMQAKPNLSDALLKTLDLTQVPELYSYCGFVVLGYYLYYHFSKRINIFALIVTIVGATAIGAALNSYTLSSNGVFMEYAWSYFSVFSIISTISFVLLFKDYLSKIHFNKAGTTVLTALSTCTFGIYLVHPFCSAQIYNFLVEEYGLPWIFLADIIIFAISFVPVFAYKSIVRFVSARISKSK